MFCIIILSLVFFQHKVNSDAIGVFFALLPINNCKKPMSFFSDYLMHKHSNHQLGTKRVELLIYCYTITIKVVAKANTLLNATKPGGNELNRVTQR